MLGKKEGVVFLRGEGTDTPMHTMQHGKIMPKRWVHRNIKIGNKVLIKQQKTTTKPAFDPKPSTVIKVKSTQVTAVRGTKRRVRNITKCKLLHIQPTYLIRWKQSLTSEKEDYAEADINLAHSLPRQQ